MQALSQAPACRKTPRPFAEFSFAKNRAVVPERPQAGVSNTNRRFEAVGQPKMNALLYRDIPYKSASF